jgi:hypothetical protein
MLKFKEIRKSIINHQNHQKNSPHQFVHNNHSYMEPSELSFQKINQQNSHSPLSKNRIHERVN